MVRLEQLMERFREVEARMESASGGAEIVRLSKEHAELRPVAEAVRTLMDARDEREELERLRADADPDMAELAHADLAELDARLPGLERRDRPPARRPRDAG